MTEILSVPYASPLYTNVSKYGGRFFSGNNIGMTIYFGDVMQNITKIDFSKMTNPDGGLATIRNTTSRIDGGFEVSIYTQNNVRIGYKKFDILRSATKSVSNLGSFTFTDAYVRKIVFRATVTGANVSFDVDKDTETTHFLMTQKRPYILSTDSITSNSIAFSWNGVSGKSYRLVERVENSFRNILDSSDIVLGSTSSSTSLTLTGLFPGTSMRVVLQESGNTWFDIAQKDVTTGQVDLVVDIGSTSASCSWDEVSSVSSYKVTCSSDSHDDSVVTSELEATFRNLIPNKEYDFDLFVL